MRPNETTVRHTTPKKTLIKVGLDPNGPFEGWLHNIKCSVHIQLRQIVCYLIWQIALITFPLFDHLINNKRSLCLSKWNLTNKTGNFCTHFNTTLAGHQLQRSQLASEHLPLVVLTKQQDLRRQRWSSPSGLSMSTLQHTSRWSSISRFLHGGFTCWKLNGACNGLSINSYESPLFLKEGCNVFCCQWVETELVLHFLDIVVELVVL